MLKYLDTIKFKNLNNLTSIIIKCLCIIIIIIIFYKLTDYSWSDYSWSCNEKKESFVDSIETDKKNYINYIKLNKRRRIHEVLQCRD